MNNRIKSLALLVNLGIYGVAFPLSAAETATDDKNSAAEETMVVTAAEQNLQAPGVSTITADEIRKRPPARDVSEIIRTMPGVNLTGNSTSGQRGNNRQIDIRGMGPENTPDPDRRQAGHQPQLRAPWLARRARHPRRYQLGAAGDDRTYRSDSRPGRRPLRQRRRRRRGEYHHQKKPAMSGTAHGTPI